MTQFYFLEGAMRGTEPLYECDGWGSEEEPAPFNLSPVMKAKRNLIRRLRAGLPVEITSGCGCPRSKTIVLPPDGRVKANLVYKDGRYSVAIISKKRRHVLGFIIRGDQDAIPPTEYGIWYEVESEMVNFYAEGDWVWRFPNLKGSRTCPGCIKEYRASRSAPSSPEILTLGDRPLLTLCPETSWCLSCDAPTIHGETHCKVCASKVRRRDTFHFCEPHPLFLTCDPSFLPFTSLSNKLPEATMA